MMKTILIGALLGCGLLAARPASAQSTLQNGLVSYWKMDEATGARIDSVGSNHLINHAALVNSGTGKIGNAAQLGGASQTYLYNTNSSARSALSFVNRSFTISAWLKINSKVSMTSVNKSRYEYALRYDASLDRFVFCVNGIFSTVTASALGAPATNTWYHVVAWYDSTAQTKSIQVNNGAVTTVAHTTGLNVNTNNFWIGALEGWNDIWNGGIDDVKIWNRTLTATERAQDYTNGSSGTPLTPSSPALNVYVAPNGSPSGNGSLVNPTDLMTALDITTTRGQPGGTIWLRGGTYLYRNDLISNIRGLPNQPITIRSYPGEWAVIDGWLYAYGSDIVMRDFEIMNSNSVRDQTTSQNGLMIYAPTSKFINLVVHDAIGDGVELWEQAVDTELHGCIIYHNGFWDTVQLRPRGHNIYSQNLNGLKTIQENIIFGAYDYGVHIYSTTATIQGYLVKDNISFINGVSPYRSTGRANLFCGGFTPVVNITFDGNATYHPLHVLHGANEFGYVKTVNTNVSVINNYMVGGNNTYQIDQFSSPVTVVNNTTVGYAASMTIQQVTGVPLSIHNINKNTYYNTEDNGSFTFMNNGIAQYSFAQWQANTGLDKASTYTVGAPKTAKAIVYRNAYETGRGNIVVYDWNLQPTVNVDLSGVLSSGAQFEIRDAQNYFGTPVLTGTYSGTPIPIPVKAASTGEVFSAFVVRTTGTGSIGANIAPTTTIASPATGATFTAPATITILANAADSDGSVSKVELYHGNTLLTTLTTAPYSFSWAGVPAGSYSLTARATDNSGAVTASSSVSITVNVAQNIPPTASITVPLNNTTFTAPANVTISASAADSDGTITKVDFYQGSTLLGSDTTAPYGYAWNSVAAGTYSLICKATDNSGAVTTSNPITIAVNNPVNVPPTVNLASPTSNATFTAPSAITIIANAADSDGTIAKVDFYQNNILLGSDSTSPYSFTWNNVAAGNYSLLAKATDNSGLTISSAPISITVMAITNIPPTVSLTSPANSTSYIAPASIALAANAVDTDGTIAKVDFYQGTTLLATVTTAPYSFTWPNVSVGSYSITAKATDNSGAVVTSGKVNITVNAAPNIPPAVAIMSPPASTSVTSPVDLAITVSATDSDGTITSVDLYDGTTLLTANISYPYSFVWTDAPVGTHSLTAKATDNSSATTASTPVTITVLPPVNIPPSIFLTSSQNGNQLTAPTDVILTATAQDSDNGIASVQIFEGATILGTSAQSPYTVTLQGLAAGIYSFTAQATDIAGATTLSTPLTVVITTPTPPNVNQVPLVDIASPVDNSSFTAPATLSITVNATDPDGSITLVELLNGSQVLASTGVAPYSFTWNNVSAGTYQITARAKDNAGAVTVSTPITVIVGSANNLAPQAVITSPSTGMTFPASTNVTIAATVNDPDGTINKVEYYQGRTLLAVLGNGPFSFTWNNVAAGTYNVAVKATDNGGAATWSNPITITVMPPGNQFVTSMNFVTNIFLGKIRNDFNGWLGMRFTVGANPVTVTQLGRLRFAGNSRVHKVKLVNANTGLDVANSIVSISMSTGTNNVFKYTALSAPITLPANASYYLLTQEVKGGDYWAHDSSKIMTTGIGTCDGAALSNGNNWVFRPGLDVSMGLVDFKYSQITNGAPVGGP